MANGPGPKSICDRCGFTVRHYSCRTEWSGLWVCRDCRDPRPPWLDAPVISPLEGVPLPNARFANDTSFIDAEAAPVLPDDL